ncbi:hypothetical protein CL684_02180 [Candidatus Campbellbacteria bacterium]|nr:hypothetical protein [Candidatus Campbellbacteria bacterium]|tara:strand:+ start:3199 stop:4434 length:1236 start_codon:yes stop_codon:yes gene_type:complete
MKKSKHIVILGAGFGGYEAYKALPQWIHKEHTVTVIDKKNHFLFTPLLPEVAGSSLDQHSIVAPLRDILHKDTRFINKKVVKVNTDTQIVSLEGEDIEYDYLISALGAETFFYGTPGAEEHCLVLKHLEDAVAIRNICIDVFEQASQIESKEERAQLLSFMVVGAGPTGAELAGEMGELLFNTLLKQHPRITRDEVSLHIVNGGPRILQMFDESLSAYAQKSLEQNHIRISNNVRINEVQEGKAITAEGEALTAYTIIWTAGVSAIDLTCECGSFEKERGRIFTKRTLQAKNNDNVFVVGDMALFPTEDGRGLPMTAQVAHQQGECAGNNLVALMRGKELKEFTYKEKGLLASLGSFDAIGQVNGFKVKGVFAWLVWRSVYWILFGFWRKRIAILGEWIRNLFVPRDTSRL